MGREKAAGQARSFCLGLFVVGIDCHESYLSTSLVRGQQRIEAFATEYARNNMSSNDTDSILSRFAESLPLQTVFLLIQVIFSCDGHDFTQTDSRNCPNRISKGKSGHCLGELPPLSKAHGSC
jgi:hypothetical protein